MDASSVLWANWQEQLKELLPGIHGHQKKTLALFVLAIVLSGCAVMQRVAETLSERGMSAAKMTSIERRLAGFIANERLVVPLIWKLFLAQVLAPFRGQKLYFVLDNTPFQDSLTIVYLGLLVHSRVLPVAWAVMPAQTKWDEGQWQIVGRLLDRVCVHLPDTSCTLIADRGLTGMEVVKLCQARGWHYLLRVCQEHTCRRYFNGKLERSWKRFEQIVLKPGFRWYGQARVWQEETLETYVSLIWDKGCEEAWLLISDQGAGRETAFRNMPGACGWKRPFKTVKAAASTLRPAGLRIVLTWIACSWRCFWRSGGPRIWQQPVFIMGNAIALIAWTGATRASFGWDDSGSWIFCVEHAIERLYAGVYPLSTPKRVGALPCVSNTQDAGG